MARLLNPKAQTTLKMNVGPRDTKRTIEPTWLKIKKSLNMKRLVPGTIVVHIILLEKMI